MTETESAAPRDTSTACVLLAMSVTLWSGLVGLAITSGVLSANLDRHVHACMTRAEIESYLGDPESTMQSTDEIPPEDRSRYDLPDGAPAGGIVTYYPKYEPEWLCSLPTAWPMWFNWVFVYYDENDIATEVHVRNFS